MEKETPEEEISECNCGQELNTPEDVYCSECIIIREEF